MGTRSAAITSRALTRSRTNFYNRSLNWRSVRTAENVSQDVLVPQIIRSHENQQHSGRKQKGRRGARVGSKIEKACGCEIAYNPSCWKRSCPSVQGPPIQSESAMDERKTPDNLPTDA